MPTPADDPLRKVTLNLYEADCLTLETHYGRGWSTQIRNVVNDHALHIRHLPNRPKTLGDLSNEP